MLEILTLMIERNLENRETIKACYDSFSVNDYLRQACTIHADIGRRSGKGRCIRDMATYGDLIIVPNGKCLPEYANLECRVMTVDEVAKQTDPMPGYDTIWVDEPRFGKADMSHIYKITSDPSLAQTYILLGE